MMDPLRVKDRILENISLSVKKLQSYFAACEDETPAIRNHDRVLQRLCRAWLYLALSESSLESYLRLFQENQALLQKYYFKNALVCSDDHLALFLTLVSGLEFIRFDLELVIPQGGSPTPCIPCCLVLTDSQLLTCHQDCQTSFFRSLGAAQLCDITSVRLQADQQYCVVEFAGDRAKFLPPWVLYFSGCGERDRLLRVLETAWRDIYQVSDAAMEKRCSEALALMSSGWQRADSLARGRAQREPWC
ncbi:hypothetical protein CRUP_032644 [Coryphaenoides rupestris]|nr:hypothetical protein CRUP_032644 [Coryphaenoides rupestris]